MNDAGNENGANREQAGPSAASLGSLANYPAIPDSCLRGSTVEQRFCEPPVAGSTPAAGLCVQWISVTERLPDGNGVVLLHAAHDSDKWITMGYRSGDGWYVIEAAEALGHHDLNRFTHWMPLPAPPADAK